MIVKNQEFLLALVICCLIIIGCSSQETSISATASPCLSNETPCQDLVSSATATPEPSPTALTTETPPAVEPKAGEMRVWEKDGASMVYVPAGVFLMGSSEENDQADGDEYPQHEVYLNGFWADRYEVTNDMYRLCVKDEVCHPPLEEGSFTREVYFTNPEFGNFPVVWVNWFDANRYCEWAGKQLPTEAQWEKAARGTDARECPWGDDPIDETLANYGVNVGDTTEVGSFSPQGDSPYGCADMAGNVLEWVRDWYSRNYESYLDQVENPTGERFSYIGARVARGGSWIYPARRARSALRVDRVPELQEGNIGFRCVFSY